MNQNWTHFVKSIQSNEQIFHLLLLIGNQENLTSASIDYLLANLPEKHTVDSFDLANEKLTRNDFVEWVNKLYFTNVEKANFHFVVIKNIDLAHPSLINSFLKIIEEPPKGIKFIFSAKNELKTLPTIRSRSQIFYFNEKQDEIAIKNDLDVWKKSEFNLFFSKIFTNVNDAQKYLENFDDQILLKIETALAQIGRKNFFVILELDKLILKNNAYIILNFLLHFFLALVSGVFNKFPSTTKKVLLKVKKSNNYETMCLEIIKITNKLLLSLDTNENFQIQKQNFLVRLNRIIDKFYE